MRDYSDEEREDFARQDGVQLHHQRRSPPRLPAGTLRIHGDNEGGCIPVSNAEFLTEREKAIFRLIDGEVLNVIRFCVEENFPVPADYRQALLRAAQAVWGYEPGEALWIEPFLVELEVGRSERLAIETREADPGSTNLFPLAEQVIERTRRSVNELAPSIELPAWLSPQLAFYLLKRFSFSGGGGRLAALTKESLRELLANPKKLSRRLRDDADWADGFARELSLLETHRAMPSATDTPVKSTGGPLVDAEHATPKERQRALEALRNHRPCFAHFWNWRFVRLENGFVGFRLEAFRWLQLLPAQTTHRRRKVAQEDLGRATMAVRAREMPGASLLSP